MRCESPVACHIHDSNRLPQPVLDSFCVVTPIFNPWRYRSRVDLYRQFGDYVHKCGGQLMTVELAFGERPFIVTTKEDKWNIQLRTNDELWHKERLLNIGIERLPDNCKYVAWVDADIRFARPDWVHETVQLLQHYPVIQMFSRISDLSPDHEQLNTAIGIIKAYQDGLINDWKFYTKYHPGFAWAARRDVLDDMGGLLDIAILGAADRHMAQAMMGIVNKSYPDGISPGYAEQLKMWQDRAMQYIKGDVGYMPGHVMHYWHGKKIHRRYRDRWQILIDNEYDPEFDLKRDSQGLHRFTDRNPKLRQDIRKYFQQRNEDSIDVC